MAYYNFPQNNPQNYPQYYAPVYPQPPMQNQQMQNQQMYQPQQPVSNSAAPNMQIQNGGFVSVPNEGIVNSYPVAPGNCVTFKIEGKPIVMEKSMGFSQLESPKIERYRLVKEEVAQEATEVQTASQESKEDNSSITEIKSEIESIWAEINALKEPKKTTGRKKEEADD